MRECRCGSGVGQIVRGDVYRLHGGDGAVLGGNDPFLELAHFGSERGLIADRGGHAPEERRDLRARLCEPEYVVYEEEHVLVRILPEILRYGEPRERHAEPCSRGLVHLPEHERGLFEHAGILHLLPEILPLARTLADTREHGIALVLERDVSYELHYEHRFAHSRAAEEAYLRALGVGGHEVDDLYARFKELLRGDYLREWRRRMVDGPMRIRHYIARAVYGLAGNVYHSSEGRFADGHGDGRAGIDGGHSP